MTLSSRFLPLLFVLFLFGGLYCDDYFYYSSTGEKEAPEKISYVDFSSYIESDNEVSSYYALTSITPGVTYSITVQKHGGDDSIFKFYNSDSSFSGSFCGVKVFDRPRACTFTAVSSVVYFELQGSGEWQGTSARVEVVP